MELANVATGAPAAGGAQQEQQQPEPEQPEQQQQEQQQQEQEQPEAQGDEEIVLTRERRMIEALKEELKNIKKDKKAYSCVNKIMFPLLVFFFVTTMVLGSLTGIRMAGSSLPCSGIQWAWNASGCNKTGALAQDKVCKVP